MLTGVDSEPGPRPVRQREIDARLDALRARLKELRERDWDAVRSRTSAPGDRLEAAQRHAAEAAVSAVQVLATSAEAFRNAAEAHERVAGLHRNSAAAGIGDVDMHERQAALHRAAAAADWERAERALSLLPGQERAGPAAVGDEPGDGVA
jgi:hypothetical protein